MYYNFTHIVTTLTNNDTDKIKKIVRIIVYGYTVVNSTSSFKTCCKTFR